MPWTQKIKLCSFTNLISQTFSDTAVILAIAVFTSKRCTQDFPVVNKRSTCSKSSIERFHSCGQHLCKFIGTKESVYIKKEFNSHRISLGHQHGRCFIVLGHQYGRRDVMWKHSICPLPTLMAILFTDVFLSFFSSIIWWARKKKERIFSPFPTPTPLRWRSISPRRFLISTRARRSLKRN